MAFKFKNYKEDEKVTQYGTKAASYEKQADTAVKNLQQNSGLSVEANDALNKVLNRQPFEYNMSGDGLYQQYKNQYVGLGKQAMKDTTAQAADLTGGFGNSYGVTAGNQAYQGYLSQLNAMVPELYDIALQRYQNETQQLANNYSLLADRDDRAYARQQDNLANLQAMMSYYGGRRDALAAEDYGRYSDERSFQYGKYADDENRKFQQEQFDYTKERDKVADSQWQQEYDLSVAAASSGGGSSQNGYSASDLNTLESYVDTYMVGENGNLKSEDAFEELLLNTGLAYLGNDGNYVITEAGKYLIDKYIPQTDLNQDGKVDAKDALLKLRQESGK